MVVVPSWTVVGGKYRQIKRNFFLSDSPTKKGNRDVGVKRGDQKSPRLLVNFEGGPSVRKSNGTIQKNEMY